MIGYGLDRGGPKDSENAPNSFLTKINEKGFWRFAVDILLVDNETTPFPYIFMKITPLKHSWTLNNY